MHLNQETIVVRKDKTGSLELSVSEVAADEDSAKIKIPLRVIGQKQVWQESASELG